LISVLIALLLVPHALVAKLLAPNPSLGKVVGAALIHVLFAGIWILADPTIIGLGPVVLFLISLVLLFIFGLLVGRVYSFSVWRGVLYGFVVAIFSAIFSLVAEKTLAEKNGTLASLRARFDWMDRAEARSQPSAPAAFVDTRQAQAAAMERYPDLAKAGSRFNQRFLDKHRAYKAQNSSLLTSPDWPWIVATEVAAELKVP
jgi:hypothetical protein